ncbi:MAG: acyl-phosphate glycerol 3-phosphate acyltransferase [Planctomycetes bacterium]|nr:acyl-phosphate glycerol 3-phosphate acyltransferase [Planctomycetota bacterium]
MYLALPFLSGYLLGSVSFALLLARARGIDLRSVGSGNLGATNTSRALGSGAGLLVFLLDAAKGAIPVLVWASLDSEPLAAVLAGAGAYLGHIWPVYLGFRGGKGVATLIGALLALAPWTILTVAPIALASVLITRIMSLGSLVLGLGLPIASALRGDPVEVLGFSAGAGLFLFWTHRSNIRRLLAGEENRLGAKKQASSNDAA